MLAAEYRKGCAFADRCAFATQLCRDEEPELREIGSGRSVACHHSESVQGELHGRVEDLKEHAI